MVTLPAILVIGIWAGMQLLGGWGTQAKTGESGGVAYAAHIGGFVAGAVAGLFSRMRMKHEPESIFRQQSVLDPSSRRIW